MVDAPFLWMPGNGPDTRARARMARAFPRPTHPMGEAWFMSEERQMYPQLLGDLDVVLDDDIAQALEEIASGSSNFGPLDEWVEWFRYLLPRLADRSWVPSIFSRVDLLITAFIAQHPDSTGDLPYGRFQADALDTLGQAIMAPRCWPDGRLDVRACLGKWRGPTGVEGWYRADGLLSASLFFCLKYLHEAQIKPWFRSVVAIADRRWLLQIVTWFVGAHPLLSGSIAQPSALPEAGPFTVGWNWSHTLNGHYTGRYDEPVETVPFLPSANREAILGLVHLLSVEGLFESLDTDPMLAAVAWETAGLRDRFVELYPAGRSAR